MPYPKDEETLKKWERALTDSFTKNPQPWNVYDDQIEAAVAVFNVFLAGKALYVPLQWKAIKAMCWVETGPFALNDTWHTRPMQIGNPGDAGLRDLLTSPQGKLILPPGFRIGLTQGNPGLVAKLNIIAGIGYLLRRLARFGIELDPDLPVDERRFTPVTDGHGIVGTVDLQSHEVMDSLTKKHIPVQRPLAPLNVHHSHYPQYRERLKKTAHMAITGWQQFSSEFASKYYNGGGDGNYADKLDFAYKLILANP